MSTDYILSESIRMEDLFDGRLESYGITEHTEDGTTSAEKRCLTDGRNWIWVYGEKDVDCLKRFGMMNAPGKILGAIADAFETEIFSEYEPQFWGFDTAEEWDAEMERIAEEHEAEFYKDLIKHVKGEPHDLRAGTIGMEKAQIAEELVISRPDLLKPESKAELMEAVEEAYSANHAVEVTLTDDDLNMVRLMTTHEEDMPSA